MKLSVRDRHRLQWALAVIVSGAAVLYAYLHLVIRPLQQTCIDGMNRLADLQVKINKANAELGGMKAARAEVAQLQAALEVSTNAYVIRPVLGSTLVSVQNIVEPIAAACGLQVESIVEHGRNEMPVNHKDAGLTIERYLMEVAVLGAYANVRDFVAMIEKTNEYACVSDVEITGRIEDVTRHRARICIEWPVFGEHKAETASVPRSRTSRAQAGGTP